MAKITFKLGDDYLKKLEAMGAKSEEMAIKAVKAGAGVVTNQIRRNLTANLNDPESASSSGRSLTKNFYNKTSGSLLESLGITPVDRDKDGILQAKVGFGDPDYDPKGVANVLKARVMESGSSTIRKRPFVRPAVNATKKTAEVAMQKVIDEEIEKTMKG